MGRVHGETASEMQPCDWTICGGWSLALVCVTRQQERLPGGNLEQDLGGGGATAGALIG